MLYLYLFFVFVVFVFIIFFVLKRWQAATFKSFAYDLMEKNSRMFFDMAGGYFEKYQKSASMEFERRKSDIERSLSNMGDNLKKLKDHTEYVEKERILGFSSLSKQLDSLINSENLLRKETADLKRALKSPNVKGAWGQLHLRRVVELSGMLNACDFFEQESVFSDDRIYRPDLVVRLPGGRQIVVDAKTPIDAYLEAFEISDEDRRSERLKKHAKDIRTHIKELGEKRYWKHFSPTPEYVILFLPAEALFSAALKEDPLLLELGAKRDVVIATPSTLIAILRAVAYSWKQEAISENAKEIAKVGAELCDRLHILNDHWNRVGKGLQSSMDAYNMAISSFEKRVLVSAKKLEKLGIEKSIK